ncbi:DNA primase [Natronoglycomyces albus]|uniref:DNA primase n=1 Tax=Natronoglycomyces albus TaxID=2811108 RepID=A0A895XPE0_9ACTN|nr:DNA primase [Natronoglycomyces albus]QSB04386.1 DNA primase [Natronoglycomyces albus]
MAGRIRDADIQLVRARVDIAEVIGERVTLRNAGGGNLKGLCPFHEERSPSFNVTPSRGMYHCFGCGVGGDVFAFVMEADGLTFVEAVERLGARAGIQLTYEDSAGRSSVGRTKPGQRQRLVEAHTAASEFYAEALHSPEGQVARAFLLERAFDKDAAATFGCGYAPDSWDALTNHLHRKGFSAEELTVAGLSKPSRSGSLIDRFRRRLMWPIRDTSGSVIGFGARKLFEDDQGPKYLNTPETPLYKKSQVLYGIDLARREIAKQGRVVIVEGYTDVMACHLAGVPVAVATCGTAFGSDHISVLRRFLFDSDAFSGEIIFTFDGDEAGQRAARKAFGDEQKFASQTYVAITPDNMDPCDLRQQRGDAAVRDLVAGREPLIDFAMRSEIAKHDLDTVEGQVAATRAVAPMLAAIKDRALLQGYARRVAALIGVDLAPLRAAVKEASRGRGQGGATPPERVITGKDVNSQQYQAQREAIKVALQYPVVAGTYFDAVDATPYTDQQLRLIREAIEAAGGTASTEGGANWMAAVADKCPDLAAQALVAELAVESLNVNGEPDIAYIRPLLARLQLPVVEEELRQLKSKLQRVNPSSDKEEYMRLFGALVTMEQHCRSLKDQASGAPGLTSTQ